MKLNANISWLHRNEVGDDVFERLIEIFPGGRTGGGGHAFTSSLAVDDPRTVALFDLLRVCGFSAWKPGIRELVREPGKHYRLVLHREYEISDLDRFHLFEFRLSHETCLFKVRRGTGGVLEIPLPPWPEDVEASSSDFLWGDGAVSRFYFVATEINDALSGAQLARLTLSPTARFEAYPPADESSAGSSRPAELTGPFWEVNSDLVMPPVSPTMELQDKDGHRQWPGRATNIFRTEGIYTWPELHYRASDLRAVGPFDIARTFENFGRGGGERMPDQGSVIVSKRFYDVCQKHGFKVDWLPVHVDPI